MKIEPGEEGSVESLPQSTPQSPRSTHPDDTSNDDGLLVDVDTPVTFPGKQLPSVPHFYFYPVYVVPYLDNFYRGGGL